MGNPEKFSLSFKPEARSAGERLYKQEKVQLAGASDTEVRAYVRVTPPAKVLFKASAVESESFSIECNCPSAKKQKLCKHAWAMLLAASVEHPDFFSNKESIEDENTNGGSSPESEKTQPLSEAKLAQKEKQEAYQAQAKARASDYRKAQYQKQKANLKKKSPRARTEEPASPYSDYSSEVQAAFLYFTENGFPMTEGPSREILADAKRKLSRFFHPDRGGSHDESVELNRNCEIILQLLDQS